MFDSNDDFELEDDFLPDVFLPKDQEKKRLDFASTSISKKPKLSHQSQKLVNLIDSQTSQNDPFFEDSMEFSTKNLQFQELNKQKHTYISSTFSEPSTSSSEISHINNINKKEPSRKEVVVHRKFPGPAGLVHLKNNLEESSEKIKNKNEEEILVSQSIVLANNEQTWIEMLKIYGTLPLDEFSVSNAKNKAFTKKLLDQKLPFFVILIKHIDCLANDQKVLFYDSTGEIYGILHEEVFKSYETFLQKGSCLVLRNVPIIGSGLFMQREYHITITLANIITIYSYNEKNINILNLNNIPINQIMEDVRKNQQKSLNHPITHKNSTNLSTSPHLPSEKNYIDKLSTFKNNNKLKERSPNNCVNKTFKPESINISSSNNNIVKRPNNFETKNKLNEEINNHHSKLLPHLKQHHHTNISSLNSNTSSSLSPFEQEITENLFDGLDASLIFDDF